jgi:hypothetical protein
MALTRLSRWNSHELWLGSGELGDHKYHHFRPSRSGQEIQDFRRSRDGLSRCMTDRDGLSWSGCTSGGGPSCINGSARDIQSGVRQWHVQKKGRCRHRALSSQSEVAVQPILPPTPPQKAGFCEGASCGFGSTSDVPDCPWLAPVGCGGYLGRPIEAGARHREPAPAFLSHGGASARGQRGESGEHQSFGGVHRHSPLIGREDAAVGFLCRRLSGLRLKLAGRRKIATSLPPGFRSVLHHRNSLNAR